MHWLLGTGQVYIGWITPQFRMYDSAFDMKKIRNVVVCTLDMENTIKSRSASITSRIWIIIGILNYSASPITSLLRLAVTLTLVNRKGCLKLQDWTLTDDFARLDIAGLDNGGQCPVNVNVQSCNVQSCNFIVPNRNCVLLEHCSYCRPVLYIF